MDIKTRLKDDNVLFSSSSNSSSTAQILGYLEKKGIITVEDLINANPKIFYFAIRNIYTAMIHVLRNAYLNEPLVHDDLLQKKYIKDDLGECLFEDILALGLVKQDSQSARYALNKMGWPGGVIDMKYILTKLPENYCCLNLRAFYINYLKKLEEDNRSKNDVVIISAKLKEVERLKEMRDDLNKRILALQREINDLTKVEYEEETGKHVRK